MTTGRRFGDEDWQAAALGRHQRLMLAQMFFEAGVRMVVGTDTPNVFVIPGESVHREMEMFVAAGIPARETLLSATRRSIEMLYGDAEEPIRVGARADLVILEDNPLENITQTQAILGFVLAGRYFDRDALDDMRDDYATAADANE